jgi:hypothetical protein
VGFRVDAADPEIEAAIADAFRRYQVAAFYCDPAKDWRSFVNAWEAKYAARLVRGREGKQVTAPASIRSSGG